MNTSNMARFSELAIDCVLFASACNKGRGGYNATQMDWAVPVGAITSVVSSGFFAFWGGVNLSADPIVTLAHCFTTPITIEFLLQYIECPVVLFGA